MTMTSTNPYADAYDAYWAAGWRGVLRSRLQLSSPQVVALWLAVSGMGVGSYQTPTYNSALSYGTSKGHGWQVGAETSTTGSAHMSQTGKSFRRGKVIGQIVMSKPRPGAKPITSRGKGMASESLWKPEDIKPIGTQNINRTSAQRASRGNPEYKQLVQQRKAAATPPKTLGELKTRLKARKAERDHARLLNDIDL